MKMTIFLTLILSVFGVAACQTASTQTSSNTPVNAGRNEVKQITVTEAEQAVKAKDAHFIDVRTTEEYAGGHAPKAANFPLDKLENDLSKLDKDQPVYVICQTGRRSQKGAEMLQKAGFKDVYDIGGGTSAWIEAGLPMEK